MKRVFAGLFIATGAVVLAIGVLACAEQLLSNDPKRMRRRRREEESAAEALAAETKIAPAQALAAKEAAKPAQRNFSIKRTKSEVGYVYWILEGYGRYRCFILCDSWAEAVEQAEARRAEVDGLIRVNAPALA